MTYFTKIPSWAYEVFWGRLTKVSSFFYVSFLKFLGLLYPVSDSAEISCVLQ